MRHAIHLFTFLLGVSRTSSYSYLFSSSEIYFTRYIMMASHDKSSSATRPRDRRDARRTLAGWKNLSKTELRAKAQMYGVEQTGKKETIALRLYSLFDVVATDNESNEPEANPVAGPSSSGEREGLQPNQPQTPNQGSSMVTFSLDDLKKLMQEVAEKANQPRGGNDPYPGVLQLSPTSTISHPQGPETPQPTVQPATQPTAQPRPAPTAVLEPPTATAATTAAAVPHNTLHQGNIESLFHSPLSSLPPLSPKLIKAMKAKEYIDLNTLLPNSLYDTTANQSYSLQVQPGATGDETVSLTQTRRTAQKITNFISWLEAWNVFIRGMVHFHPHLAPDLLAYQESFSALSRNYQFQSCYKYDIAFRMNVARNHYLPWSRLDEYAFNRFLRCAPPSQPLACFRCHMSGHFAADCPSLKSRDNVSHPGQSMSTQAYSFNGQPPFRAKQPFYQAPCRHFNANNCRDQNCRWPHICNRCRGPHPATNCPRLKQ